VLCTWDPEVQVQVVVDLSTSPPALATVALVVKLFYLLGYQLLVAVVEGG